MAARRPLRLPTRFRTLDTGRVHVTTSDVAIISGLLCLFVFTIALAFG
jgi:hypothetical protein